ncbi:rod-binding protein [Pseudooceanicola aestuarii]|uniref:rod-binding protein n=1 Tax=Pseudooceanicola aestuarii TaxID=2697319 RepID=UPI0013D880A8|nr:rod-binding protein [Pseudooceanicola aestuarii]
MDIKTAMAALQVTQAQQAQPGAAAPDAPSSAAREFEKMYLTQMFDEMLKEVDIGSLGAGTAEEHWRYFLAEATAEQLAAQGGIGLAQQVGRALDAYDTTRKLGES